MRPGGLAVAYKSRKATEELEAARRTIETLGAAIHQIADIVLPGTAIERKLILLQKRPVALRKHF